MKPVRIVLATLAIAGAALLGTASAKAAPVSGLGEPAKVVAGAEGSIIQAQYWDRDRRWRPAPRYYSPPPRYYYPPARYYYPPPPPVYYPPRYYQPCVGIFGVPVGAQFCF
jgi:hypothetical protein